MPNFGTTIEPMAAVQNYIAQYYDAIQSGQIRAGKYIKKIYQILTDGIADGTYIFNPKMARTAFKYIENYCHHS